MVYLEIPILDPTSVSIVHCPLSIARVCRNTLNPMVCLSLALGISCLAGCRLRRSKAEERGLE